MFLPICDQIGNWCAEQNGIIRVGEEISVTDEQGQGFSYQAMTQFTKHDHYKQDIFQL